MIARKAEEKIRAWIRNSRKALLVSGARQVGKTFSICRSLQEEHCDYIRLNLIEQPSLVRVLERSYTVEDLAVNLTSVMSGISLQKGKTFIFIDEIQEFPDVVTRIKFWVDEGSYRFVLSGSLLGIELKSIRSAPVGYMTEITMYPLDFEEFLRASRVGETTLEYLRSCFTEKKPLNEPVHEAMMRHFRRYLVVGGMPEAVRQYVETGDMNKVSDVQQDILAISRLDFSRFEQQDRKLMLHAVFDQIPAQLLRQNRRFHYADIQKKLRFERISSSFLWLVHAGVAIASYNATAPRIALTQNEDSSLFKLYSSDVGLLTFQYGAELRQKILLEDDMSNLGGIFENYVAQALNTRGFPLFFYLQTKMGELDFLVAWKNRVVPIEVKSGKVTHKHLTLDKIMDNPQYEIQKSFVFCTSNFHTEGRIQYCPIYLCGWMEKDVQLPVLDLPGDGM